MCELHRDEGAVSLARDGDAEGRHFAEEEKLGALVVGVGFEGVVMGREGEER